MISQSSYDSLEEIPERFEGSLRDEFHQVNGKWVLKDTAIPGVGALFNKALYDNEQRAVTQAKNQRDKAIALQTKLDEAEAQLATYQTAGHVVLSEADAKTWDRYSKLGTPKDLEERIKKLGELEGKVNEFELAKSLKIVSSTGNLNVDVLTDWATSSEGSGLSFFVKEVEGKSLPFVKIELTNEQGKVTVEEKELLPFAKDKLPEWKYNVLTSGATEPPKSENGVRMPFSSSANKPEGKKEDQKPVDRFNAQRAAAQNPFEANDKK